MEKFKEEEANKKKQTALRARRLAAAGGSGVKEEEEDEQVFVSFSLFFFSPVPVPSCQARSIGLMNSVGWAGLGWTVGVFLFIWDGVVRPTYCLWISK